MKNAKHRRFSEQEKEWLKQNYSNFGIKYCSEFLKRSYQSVALFCNRSGLKVSSEAKGRIFSSALIRNLTGLTFGKLKVIKFSHKKNKRNYWECICDCGNTCLKNSHNLLDGSTNSCGCLVHKITRKDLTGYKYGEWTVLYFDEQRHQNIKEACWICKCSCGNTIKSVRATHLKSGASKCCGCKGGNFLKGKENPLYKSEISDEERIILAEFGKRVLLPGYSEWRKSVLERDNYTCQLSGQKGGKLCVHHLEGWTTNKELRMEITNGITIRQDLHKLFHKMYGKSLNTTKQFLEFKDKFLKGEINV